MTVFVDTSALFALLDADDQNHTRAKDSWSRLLAREEELVTTNGDSSFCFHPSSFGSCGIIGTERRHARWHTW